MSTQNTQSQPTLPDPETAYNHLFSQVHANVFFNKLASHGYAPRNEKEAEELLTLAGKLRDAEHTKAAQDNSQSPYALANSALDNVLGSPARTVSHQKVAQELMQDPSIYDSVLSLKVAEAEQFAQQLAGDDASA